MQAENLRANIDDVRAAEARRDVETEIERTLEYVRELPGIKRPAHQNLIDQMAIGHRSSIAERPEPPKACGDGGHRWRWRR